MKILLPLMLITFLSIGSIRAQETNGYNMPKEGTFVIQGKAINVPKDQKTFKLAVCDPFDNEGLEVPYQKDGSFQQVLPVVGTQDLYLYLGDAVTIFTYAGDTLNLTFDYKDCPASIRLTGNTEERTRELELSLELYHKYRKSLLDLNKIPRNNYKKGIMGADSVLLHAIAQYATDYQNTIQEYTARHGSIAHEEYLYQRGYFNAIMGALSDPIALDKLFIQLKLRCYPGEKGEKSPIYQSEAFNPFLSSAATNFMLSYISRQFTNTQNLFGRQNAAEWFPKTIELADIVLLNKALRDWFLTVSLKRGLNWFDWKATDELEVTANQLLASCTTPQAIAELEENIKKHFSIFRPGKPAPEFTLPNDKGKSVSLKDLKGKIVLLDFWSDGCGPCIMEFKQQEALHTKYEAYKDQIAYVYICLGSSDKQWKNLIKKYNLQGINLHASSWKDEAISTYSSNAVPLYVLIDQEGKIVVYNDNQIRPSNLVKDVPNALDKLLKK